jgi:hypothetical protein
LQALKALVVAGGKALAKHMAAQGPSAQTGRARCGVQIALAGISKALALANEVGVSTAIAARLQATLLRLAI